MSIVEISLTPQYVESWGLWEGIRELVQNAIDGEREHDAKMSIRCTDKGTLIIENNGVTIPREALLIGFSTKTDRDDLSGKFGEGLKLGTMALVRAGFDVNIRNGAETWKPEIRRSDKFNSKVLAFQIRKAKTDIKGLRVEVKGVGQEKWEEMEQLFTFLNPPSDVIETHEGSLIMDPDYKGMLFVRGIFVDRDAKFQYAYDLKDVEIDRDRRMLNRWDLRWTTSRIWDEAMMKRASLIKQATALLSTNCEEIENLGNLSCLRQEVVDGIAKRFEEEEGEDAVPVTSLSQSKEIEHLGKRGVRVPDSFAKVLEKKYGAFEAMKNELKKEKLDYFSWTDLTEVEQTNLEQAIAMVAQVDDTINFDKFDVVKFYDDYTLGQFVDGRCRIARTELSDLSMTLRVVAHEWCHYVGDDESHRFSSKVETLLAEVAVAMSDVNKTSEQITEGSKTCH